jgi:DNA-binding NarL/FixJ family response regulator
MAGPVGVVVVGDHPVFREGFAALLGSIDEVRVLGTASSGREALERVEAVVRGRDAGLGRQ